MELKENELKIKKEGGRFIIYMVETDSDSI